MGINNFLVADPDVLNLYKTVLDFADFVNQQIKKIYDYDHLSSLDSAALYSISSNILSLHKAIFSLCKDGWSFAAPILLRTMIELIGSMVVIINSKDESQYMAFKYSYIHLKEHMSDPTISEEYRKEINSLITKGIQLLDENFRERAKKFIFKDKLHKYWYRPEISNPEVFFEPNIKDLWKEFCGSVHGKLFGLTIMRGGEPDKIHSNPQADKKAQNLALSISSRCVLEAFRGRAIFEKIQIHQIYNDILRGLNKLLV